MSDITVENIIKTYKKENRIGKKLMNFSDVSETNEAMT